MTEPPFEEPSSSLKASTGTAPTFRQLNPTIQRSSGSLPSDLPPVGQQFHDFQLLSVLGEGSFARVYLAIQVSLGRQVALKVSANRGLEARTMATLEHEHIVQVFSEQVDEGRGLRLLCMQYVPGSTLERLLMEMVGRHGASWSGKDLVEVLDGQSQHRPTFDPTALRDRELLAAATWPAAVCWLGSRIAEALAYAHRQGVLHRDVKPANILLNHYGRPLLTDFNIALDAERAHGPTGAMFGGTLAYMAPEHLDAMNHVTRGTPASVDERSDLYALGVVLYELITGHLPFHGDPLPAKLTELLTELASRRRSAAPSPRAVRPSVPESLDRVIRRCLDPDPSQRYPSASELAESLEACRRLERIQQELPAGSVLTRWALQRPFLWLAILALGPQVLGSLVNISYNTLRIVTELTANQQEVFERLVLLYNGLAYPIGLVVLYRLLQPALQLWGKLLRSLPVSEEETARVRQGVLTWPGWMLAMSCLCWLPGGLVFPIGIHLAAGPLSLSVFGHFAVSFTISGLIALTYSFCGVEFLVLRVLYPRLWAEPRHLERHIQQELGCYSTQLQLTPWLAGTIPLSAAILLVLSGANSAQSMSYRLLVAAMILVGMAGFGLAIRANNILRATLAVLTRSERR